MKRFYLSKLVILTALLLGFDLGSSIAQVTTSFLTNGAYIYTVPAGVTAIGVDMAGATGGKYSSSYTPGKGGRLQCEMNVTPLQVLYIYVGGKGTNGACCGTSAGGYNGGGNGYYYGSAGGGGTDISTTQTTPASSRTRILVAGGGGGSGEWCTNDNGGDGGGLTGVTGMYCGSPTLCYVGQGGTQTAGGASGTCWGGGNGSFGQGGNAYTGYYYQGGGGGGWYGGGGALDYGGGGGGSSYPATAGGAITSLSHTQGYNASGDGYVMITTLVPAVISNPASLNFGVQTTGTLSVPKYVSLTGLRLTGFPGTLTITPPSGYNISLDGITWISNPGTLTIPYSSANLAAKNLYVQFAPGFSIPYCGNIVITGGGQPTNCTIPLCGTGVSACSSLPVAGTSSALPASAGVSTPITLSLAGSTAGGSITYQWQQSIDAGATWTDINGAVLSTSTITGITVNTMFRCKVTCPSSGTTTSTTSSITFVAAAMTASSCTPTCANTPSCCGFWVGNTTTPFVLNGDGGTKINDNTAATSSSKYFDLTASQSVTLTAGNTYTCTNGYSAANPNSFQIWIDFNNNGIFDPSESVGGVNWNAGTVMPVTNVVIPATAAGGTYRMRAQVDYASGCGSSTPCYPSLTPCPTTAISYAETRDYTCVIAFPNCSGTPNPGITFTPVTSNCGPFSANMFNIGASTGAAGLTYQWQSSPDNSSWSDIPGAVNPVYTQSVTSTLYYRAKTTCAFSTSAIAAPVTQIVLNTQPVPITGTSTFCSANPSTLTCTTPGGSWSSSNPAVASVGTGGVVTGLSAGTATISYTMPTGCFSSKVVTVFLSPGATTGASTVCTGLTTILSNGTSGGVWTSSNNLFATVGSSSGIVTGVAPGSYNIVYTIPAGGCSVSFPMTTNQQPGPITGTASVCEGAITTMSNSIAGGVWASSNSFQASVSSTGLVTGLTASTPNISYTLPGGCFQIQAVTVNPKPSAISGTPVVCVNSTTALTDVTAGGVWSSSNGSVATIGAGTGIVTGIASGSSNIIYTLTSTGCSNNVNFTVNLLPTVFTVGGGGGYCAGGSGSHVTLNNSAVGTNYDLYYGGSFVTTLPGSATGLDFGAMTSVGSYTVRATDASTGCTTGMAGSSTVSINPLPAAYTLSVVGTGAYCFGGTGVDLKLSSSDVGVNYQVWNGLPIGMPVAGTGVGTLDLGYQTGAGSYTVMATNLSTLCSNTMTGSPTVSINTPPTIFNVTASGTSYCAGGGGIDVMVSGSTVGVNYALYNGVTLAATMAGTGSAITFTGQTAAGNYTVIATDGAGCVSTMSGSASISITALPAIQTVTGGGAFCAGGPGKHIGLVYSVAGTSYDLNDAFGSTVSTVTGANSGLDFGAISATGTYTVVATNSFGCTSTMAGSATIGVNLLPNPYSVTGGGGYCAGDPGMHVTLSSYDATVRYQLYRNSSTVGTPVLGSGASLDFGLFTNPGYYTVVATNPVTGCTNNMVGGVNISINPLPNVYTVTGGGAYCATGAGSEVDLVNSENGVDYSLYDNGAFVMNLPGGGALLSFGLQTGAGTYTVKATNLTTTCVANMAGSASVSINPLPINYTVTGGGAYCDGGAGLPIGLSLSATGVDYQLLNGSTPVGSVLGGTGKALNFGVQGAGSYSIQATNTLTGCMNTGSTLGITMNALPTQYTVTGGAGLGNICATDTGRHIYLSGSDLTATYQLYKGTTAVGLPMTGGAALDFGLHSAAGTYTVVAKDVTSACTNNMISSYAINVTPAPTAYTVTGGGSRCPSDMTGLKMNLSSSDFGIRYQVYNGATMDGTFFAGTGLPIYLGAHTSGGSYTVVATDPSTGCINTMSGSPAVTVITPTTPVIMVSVSKGTDTVCSGVPTTFSALVTSGGGAPSYQWKVNGIPMGTSPSFTTRTLVNGDIVSAVLTTSPDVAAGYCPSPATVLSNDVTMTVNPSALPTASITVTPSDFVCPGTAVTFTAKSTYGSGVGGTANYEWIRNGVSVATGSSYTYTPSDSTIVFATLKSTYECASSGYVLSNTIPVAINEPVLPMFMISELSSTSVNKGEDVSLKAIVSNPGSFSYQWFVDGNAVSGATNPTFKYTTSGGTSQHVVKCVVTSHGICGGLSATQSTLVNVRDNTGVKSVGTIGDVRVVPNPNKGTFTVKGSLGTAIDEEVSMEITNMLGQVVYSNKVMSHGGNISEQVQLNNTLANGMYLLNLRSASGNAVFHFVIEQ